MSAAQSRPTRRWLRRVVALAAIALSARWALAPIDSPTFTQPNLTPPPARESQTLATLDLAPFHTPLWVAEPAPPEPEKPPPAPPPPKPLKLQLIAITGEADDFRAVMYDPDADQLRIVTPGQSLAEGRIVDSITSRAIHISGTSGVQTLALQDGAAP